MRVCREGNNRNDPRRVVGKVISAADEPILGPRNISATDPLFLFETLNFTSVKVGPDDLEFVDAIPAVVSMEFKKQTLRCRSNLSVPSRTTPTSDQVDKKRNPIVPPIDSPSPSTKTTFPELCSGNLRSDRKSWSRVIRTMPRLPASWRSCSSDMR